MDRKTIAVEEGNTRPTLELSTEEMAHVHGGAASAYSTASSASVLRIRSDVQRWRSVRPDLTAP